MTANKISAKKAHILANKIIAVLYAGLVCWVTWAAVSSGAAAIMIYMLPALVLAAGHFKYKRWALMTSSVIFGLISGLGVLYVAPFGDSDKETPMSELPIRIKHYSFIAMLALLMMLNYYFYGRLEKTSHTAIEGDLSSVVTDRIKAKGWLLSVNRVIAFAYAGLSCFVPPSIEWTPICSLCDFTEGIRLPGFEG